MAIDYSEREKSYELYRKGKREGTWDPDDYDLEGTGPTGSDSPRPNSIDSSQRARGFTTAKRMSRGRSRRT